MYLVHLDIGAAEMVCSLQRDQMNAVNIQEIRENGDAVKRVNDRWGTCL